MSYGGLIVPQIPAGLGPLFVQTDWRTETAVSAAPAGASGILTATSDVPPEDEWWLIERLIVLCTSTTVNTTLDLYVGQAAPQYERDWTPQGGSTANKGIAEYPRGLLMEPSQPLIIQWSGASAGSTSFWAAQVQVYKRIG